MPTAINPDTGEIVTLGNDGQWVPAQRAKNPDTGAEVYLDGNEWKPVPYQARMPERMRARYKDDESRGLRQGFMDQVVQGATMGFSDEISAARDATLGSVGDLFKLKAPEWGKRYDEELEYQRDRLKKTQAEHPVVSAVGQVAGGMTAVPAKVVQTAVPIAKATAPTLFQTAKRGAIIGGTTGGVSGFGAGEDGLSERLESAGQGAALGAVLGGVTPYIIEGGRRVAGHVKGALGIGDQKDRARRLLLRALERDDLSVDDLVQRADDVATAGSKGEMLTDLGGENVQRLTRGAASVPGQGTKVIQEAVETRNAGQADRVLGDIRTYISPADDFHGLMDAVGNARRTNAAPLYDAAYDTHKFVWSPKIQNFLDDPVIQQGIRKGMVIQRLEALAEGRKLQPNDFGVVDFDEAGVNIVGGKPNLRLLNAAKMGLDEIINDTRNAITGKPKADQMTAAIEKVRRNFVTEIDNITAAQNNGRSLYAEARRAWAGPSAAQDALSFGRRDVLKSDPELIAKRIAGMSETEREFTKAGVARALADIVNGKADDLDVTRGMLRNEMTRKRLRAVFGNDASIEGFVTAIERERDLLKKGAFVSPRTGSQTQPRQADVAELVEEPGMIGEAASRLAQGSGITGAAVGAARSQVPRLTQGVGAKTGAEIARMATARSPQNVRDVVQELRNQAAVDEALRQRMLAITSGLIAPAEGRLLGLNSP